MSGGERRSPRLSWLRWVGLAAVLLLGLRVGLAAVLGRVLDGVVAPHGLALSWDSLSLGLLDLDGAGGKGSWRMGNGGVEALLEDMVRAWSREPERLRDVQRVVEPVVGPPAGLGQSR